MNRPMRETRNRFRQAPAGEYLVRGSPEALKETGSLAEWVLCVSIYASCAGLME